MGSMEAIIARGLPPIDPVSDFYKAQNLALERQQNLLALSQARQMGPLRVQAAQQEAQIRQTALEADQREQASQASWQASAAKPENEGDPHKILLDWLRTGKPSQKHYAEQLKNITDTEKAQAETAKNKGEYNKYKQEFDATGSSGIAQAGYTPTSFLAHLSHQHDAGYITQQQADDEWAKAKADPAYIKQYADSRMPAAAQKTQLENVAAQRTSQKSNVLESIDNVEQQSGAGYDELRAANPLVPLPPVWKPGTAGMVKRTLGVPVEKQPTYDIDQMKLRMGVLGNSEFDQFFSQYARSLNKAPAQLTPQEAIAGFGKYAELKQDPVMRSLAISQKGISEALARTQLANMPTQDDANFLAQKLINHEMSPSEFNQIKMGRAGGGFGIKVFRAAENLKPGFDAEQAEADYKSMERTENAFTSGKEAGLVRANNNALEHLAMLDQARVALANGNIPALNAIANYFGVQTGSDKATVFNHIAHRVGDEVQKAFVPGGGGQAERQASAGSYDYNLGDQQIASNIRADVHLMDSQQRSLQKQYERGTFGKGRQPLYTDEAMAARAQLLGGGTAPAGKIAVISPEGVRGFIDADKWDAAQKRGFKRQ